MIDWPYPYDVLNYSSWQPVAAVAFAHYFNRYVTLHVRLIIKCLLNLKLSRVSLILQDQDILHSWLMDIRFEEYFPLFVAAGYDMHTISRMTPEDLTAIGIKKPNHRKKLKAEIAQLNISDGLPEFIPVSKNSFHFVLITNVMSQHK